MKKCILLVGVVCAIVLSACKNKSEAYMPEEFTVECTVDSPRVSFYVNIHCRPRYICGAEVIPRGPSGILVARNRDMSDSTYYMYYDRNSYTIGYNEGRTLDFDDSYYFSIKMTKGKYYYYAFADAPYSARMTTAVDSFSIGSEFTLPTFSEVATFTNLSASNVLVSYRIFSKGESNITAYGVCYNTTGMPTITDPRVSRAATSSDQKSLLNDVQDFYISGLSGGTKYYLRAFAITSIGISYSKVWVVTTENVIK